MDERTRTRSARNDRLTYIGQMMNIKKAAPKWSHLSEQLTRCAVCVNNHKPGHDNRDQAGGQCDQCGGLLVGYSRSLSLSGRDFHVCTPILGRLYVLMNCSIRNVFTSRSLRFSAISCFIFWINHSSGSGMVYSLLTEMRRSSSHLGAGCFYPLGSMPRRFSSVRPNSLSQLARLMPSLCASLSNCSFSSGEIRILNCGDCPSPLGLLSRLIVDKWSPIELAFLLLGDHLNTRALKKAKPRKCHYHSQGF